MNDEQYLDSIRELRDELKELVREAHGAVKDLRKAMEEAPRIVSLLTARRIEEQVGAEVQRGLDEYKANLTDAIEAATESVYQRFEAIANVLVGKGSFSLESLAMKYVEAQRDEPKKTVSALLKDG